jgi:hypothetical protein
VDGETEVSGRRQLCYSLRCNFSICLERLRKNDNNSHSGEYITRVSNVALSNVYNLKKRQEG